MTYIARICDNASNWQHPTRTANESKDSFHSMHGYGHEEWLFRFEWQIGGWQYGFLQGVNKGWKSRINRGERVGDVVLYTHSAAGRRYVARIRHVEFLDGAQAAAALEHYKERGWYDQMLKEIDEIGGERSGLGNDDWAPNVLNVRFRVADVEWYPPDVFAAPDSAVSRNNRYQLVEIDDVAQLPSTVSARRPGRKGQATPPVQDSYYASGGAGRECSPEHWMLVTALHKELLKEFSEKEISFETNFVDVTVTTATQKILYEVKSDYSTRRVLRQAIGQLLEYAYYWDQPKANQVRLVAVGRTELGAEDEVYLKYLQDQLKLPLDYQQVKLPSEK